MGVKYTLEIVNTYLYIVNPLLRQRKCGCLRKVTS